ncbi:hypothetical protein JHK84_045721 [Glycine max]|nr:hypothetical protein JHK84_045721 [Glycine max]KAH1206805.1 hypothetical protein GmHk_16G047150 [Glycine max]
MNEMVWNAKLEQVEAMMNRAKFTLADRLNVDLMLNVEVQYEDMAQAFFVEKGITCFVACLRNEGGDFLQARTAFITTNMSVKEGEAIVVLQTLIWLSNQQVYNVIIELDSKLVVDQIHSNEEDISECGMINQIKDIYHEIFSFYDCSI